MNIAKVLLHLIIISAFSYPVLAQNSIPENVLNAEIPNLKGAPFRLADGDAKVKVIFLWASWCGPCRFAANDLGKIYKTYDKRGVEIIGLTDENPQTDLLKVKRFVRVYRIKYKIGWMSWEVEKILTDQRYPRLVPIILVVNNKGEIDTKFIGYDLNKTSAKVVEAINRVLNKSQPQPNNSFNPTPR